MLSRLIIKYRITDILDRMILRNKDFAIISNNCWGFSAYKIAKKPYNTPFIGLYIIPADFIKMCANLSRYIGCTLNKESFIKSDMPFPVARIQEITIYFMHYQSEEQAIRKWNDRMARLVSYIAARGVDNIIFKMCERDGEKQHISAFNALPFPRKIGFEKAGIDTRLKGKDGDLLTGDQLFNHRFIYYRKYISLYK
ncbi:DUF1919 domain-containing protein [Edwardsiella piscicida]|uniref:DUF1919 domain-containing protein n=1 Tax=Edwardsiella piscicida TaxID=1263550 RepID=UPI00370D1E26